MNEHNKMKKSALIAGASGLVGSKLLQILLNSNVYNKIHVIVRTPLVQEHSKLHQHVIEFNNLDEYASLFAVDDVYCCLGTTIKKAKSQEAFKHVDVNYPLKIAQLANQHHVTYLGVVSSLGANPTSKIFYSRMKGILEQELKRIGLHSLHIYRPSLLLGAREEKRRGEEFSARIYQVFPLIFKGPLKPYKPISAHNVAHYMYKQAQMNQSGYFIHNSNDMQKEEE